MKKFYLALAILAVLCSIHYATTQAAPYPPALGGTGTSQVPASGTVPIGNGAGTYTPASIICVGGCTVTNGSGTITITAASSSAILTNAGNWAGTWQLKNPSDFLASSTSYVSSVNGLTGAVTITFPATTTINGTQAPAFYIVGDNSGITSTVSGATTTFKLINTGNWAGTWQGVNSTTFYLASNPNGYISSDAPGVATTTINGFTGTVFDILGTNGQINRVITNGSTTYSLASTTVTAGSYTYTGLTVDALGRITAASNGGTPLLVSNNLSDLGSSSTARTNLGLGTSATRPSTDYLASSTNLAPSTTIPTVYVTSLQGLSGTLTIATSTQAGTFNVTSSASTLRLIIPPANDQYFAPSTTIPTVYVANNLGNWTGTWQNVNSSSFYLASNPSGFITTTTIPSPLVVGGNASATIFGNASSSYILNFNSKIQFPVPTALAALGCAASSTLTDPFACLQYLYNTAASGTEIDVPVGSWTGSGSFSALTADKNVLIQCVPGGGSVFNETATSGVAITIGSGSASHVGDGMRDCYLNGPNSGTGTGISVSSTLSNAGEGVLLSHDYVTHFWRNIELGNNVYLVELDGVYSRFNFTNNSGGGLLYMDGNTNAGETIGIGGGTLFSDGQPAANQVEIQTSGETNVEMVAPCSIDDAQLYINQYGGQGNNVHVECHLEDPAADTIPTYIPVVMNSGNPFLNDTVSFVNATFQNDATTHIPACDISLYGQLVMTNVGLDNNGGGPVQDVVCLGESSDTIFASGLTYGNNGNGPGATYLYNSVPLVGGVQTYNVSSTFAGAVTFSGSVSTTIASALVSAGSNGVLSAYGGASACPGGQAVTTISVAGATTCAAFGSSNVSTSTANTWTALQTFSLGATINGPLTVGSTTNALLFAGSAGAVSGYGGSSCTAGSVVTSVSATGTVACVATSTILTGYSTSTGANPTANIGTSATNGSANTFIRSDAAPALSSQFASSSISFNMYDATTTAPYRYAEWIPNKSITIASVLCSEYAGATTTIELYQATATATTTVGSDLVASIACGIGGTSTSTINSATVAAGIPVIANVSSTAGTPSWTTVTVYYKTN